MIASEALCVMGFNGFWARSSRTFGAHFEAPEMSRTQRTLGAARTLLLS